MARDCINGEMLLKLECRVHARSCNHTLRFIFLYSFLPPGLSELCPAVMPNPEHYTVGWICARFTEHTAARQFLEKEHGRPDYLSPRDSNDYTLGEIAGHNVVISGLPDGEYGLSSATGVAMDMLNSFPNIRIGLMVGIGGGAPTSENDIRLGDVVVSSPRDGIGGVYQYDYGKTIQGRDFHQTGFLDQPPTILRNAVSGLRTRFEDEGHQIEESIKAALEKKPRLRKKYSRPAEESDRLYKSNIVHPHDRAGSCKELCETQPTVLVDRPKRNKEDTLRIHYGLVASSNQLMKDALKRDALAREKGVLCFEMEAAGLMNRFPSLVIRGICNYSDSHKNEEWEGYAAMAAAAYAANILRSLVPMNGNALHAAAFSGYNGIVQMLIDKGADINAQGGEYSNALQAAVLGGHNEILQMLLNRGASVNA